MKVANRERQVPGNTSRLFHHYVQHLKPLSHRMSSPSLRSIRSLDWGRQLGKLGPTHSSIYTVKTLGDSWSFGLIEPTSGDLDRHTWVNVRENAKRWAYSCLMFASCSCLFLHNIYDSPINTTSKTIWCVFLACNEPKASFYAGFADGINHIMLFLHFPVILFFFRWLSKESPRFSLNNVCLYLFCFLMILVWCVWMLICQNLCQVRTKVCTWNYFNVIVWQHTMSIYPSGDRFQAISPPSVLSSNTSPPSPIHFTHKLTA